MMIKCILSFLNYYQGAFMVLITAVYVFATILICKANMKSSNAAKAQLEEMKKQFDEENRPVIEAEFILLNRVWFVLRLVNHGKRTAQHVKTEFSHIFLESLPDTGIKALIEKGNGKECIIGVDQHYDFFIGDSSLCGRPEMKPIQATVTYEANGRVYSSEIYVDLENYMTIYSTDSDEDKLREAINKNTKALHEIKNVLKKNSDQQSLSSYLENGGKEDANA